MHVRSSNAAGGHNQLLELHVPLVYKPSTFIVYDTPSLDLLRGFTSSWTEQCISGFRGFISNRVQELPNVLSTPLRVVRAPQSSHRYCMLYAIISCLQHINLSCFNPVDLPTLERFFRAMLYWAFVLHRRLDDTGNCSNARKGQGLEDGELQSMYQCAAVRPQGMTLSLQVLQILRAKSRNNRIGRPLVVPGSP